MRHVFHASAALLSAAFVVCVLVNCGSSTVRGTMSPDDESDGSLNGDTEGDNHAPLRTLIPSGSYTYRAIADATARNAVCNDGSPAGYYITAGSSVPDHWLVYLKGGGSCTTIAECEKRPTSLKSSTLDGGPFDGDGITALDTAANPDFAGWTHVYVPYCSSDWWSGNLAPSDATGGLAFRGSAIVAALIEDLQSQTSPGIDGAVEVLFAGGSAGGVGVVVNVDRVALALPQARTRGLCDAGWVVDGDAYNPPLSALELAGLYRQFWGGRPDDSCVAARTDAPEACYIGTSVLPYLSTPTFVNLAQADRVQLGNLGVSSPFDADEEAYVEDFINRSRASLDDVEAAFSPADSSHIGSESSGFTENRIDGYSYATVLGNWFFERAGPAKEIADDSQLLDALTNH